MTTGLSCRAIPCLTRSELKEGQYWSLKINWCIAPWRCHRCWQFGLSLHTTKARLGKENGSQQGLTQEASSLKLTEPINEQWLLPQPFYPPTGSNQGGIWWLPFYTFLCSLCQVTCSKLLERSHISEQDNPTICLSETVTWNPLSFDWGSALNSSTVLGDLSERFSPRMCSDWFFREQIAWGIRWSKTDRENACV